MQAGMLGGGCIDAEVHGFGALMDVYGLYVSAEQAEEQVGGESLHAQ